MFGDILNIFKFCILFPLDFLLDTVVFGSISLINAFIASFIASLLPHSEDTHTEEHEHEHHHDDIGDISMTDAVFDHAADLPSVALLATLDYAANSSDGAYLITSIYEQPVIGDLHQMLDVHFNSEVLSTTSLFFELLHTGVHLIEAFKPYQHIIIDGVSLQDEVYEICEHMLLDVKATASIFTGWSKTQHELIAAKIEGMPTQYDDIDRLDEYLALYLI